MEIISAEYWATFVKPEAIKNQGLPEYAFIGRSNVGKSSLINMLCKRNALAHVSKKPGKTQTINFFTVNNAWYLVDLPGYGYAKVGKKLRRQWSVMVEQYLKKSPYLVNTFVLIDIRVPPQQLDIDFINWLGKNQLPFSLVFTKMDALKPEEVETAREQFRATLLEHWHALPPDFATSGITGEGREALLSFIDMINKQI